MNINPNKPIDGVDISILSAMRTADDENRPSPSTRELAIACRISNGAVARRLKLLADRGYLQTPREGAHRAYRITDLGKQMIVDYIRPDRVTWGGWNNWPPR